MTKSFIPRSIAAVLLFATVSASTGAHAEPNPGDAGSSASAGRVAELNEAGAKAYANRNYRGAIEKFVEAYAVDHDPNLLFNIARCYEKLGEVSAAIEKYEAFIAAPGADTDGRLKAQSSLRELRALESQGGTRVDRPKEATAPNGDPAPNPETAAAPGASSSPRLLPWLALGGGVVLAGVGATFYVLGMRDHDRVTDAPGYGESDTVHPMTRAEAQDYVDSGDTKKIIGGVGLGVGGALLATSALLFLSAGRASQPEQATALRIEPSSTGFFAAYAGKF